MRVLFVCGGSAGHINPALAIASHLRDTLSEATILFVGADKVLEKRLVPAAGFDLVNIKMSGLRRGFSPGDILHNIKTAYNLITAGYKSANLLREYKPDAVIGTGGYICYPVIKKAARLGIATFVLEPNAYPGLTVRMLSAFTDKVFVTYPGLKDRYKRPERVVYTGTPLRREFFEGKEKKEESKKKRPLVVSYWGSIGAAGMNEMIFDFIQLNKRERKFDHIHSTGVSGGAKELNERLKFTSINDKSAPVIDIREYIEDMNIVMASADLVISRAGASTIAELTALGKPAVLIPSPNVTENHQEENAKQLQQAGGAIMIRENECTSAVLYRTVSALLNNKDELKKMSVAQKSLSISDASKKIVEEMLEFLEGRAKK
ncbi:MAG: UDP-N-acetylglucosamine--N-acetylmuramyl-(pentapeptide) pyrophosphoryl-undecaprenol N-acetylglucosamine transferase [Oscillospiraceae bacterium]|jgi:UDP-N-acetylglucosamine--N-acetylmuramyl-(pentapeptide) pyrophosphoryl-undecaprenol N-acetylglucosamine transferase|nr:UDP-N-acetylglucosamine--N-acetylmuramyl-(pentapeptide) pyrophosphoryl-undecaprenol N-acetylglucosamine transferase [Oscillospiraceae bacterium]